MALHSRMGRSRVQAQRYERFPLVSLGTSSKLSRSNALNKVVLFFFPFFPFGTLTTDDSSSVSVVDDDEAVP